MTVRIELNKTRGHLEADIRVRLPNGRLHRERRRAPVQTQSGAQRWGEARERHLLLYGLDVPEKRVPLFKEFGARWMNEYAVANGNKPSSLDAKERILRLHLYPTLGSLPLNEIDDAQVQKLKLAIAGKADKTRACVLSQLATIMKTAMQWKEILAAPLIEAPRYQQPEMEFYDFDDYERLVEGARRAGAMQLAFVLLGGDAGLRRGEIVALEQRDIGEQITVQRSEWTKDGKVHVGSPKGGKTRRVPMTTRLKAAIAAVRHLRGARLLWKDHGKKKHVTHTTLQSWMETSTRRAGLPESRDIHKLRHTFCSHLAMKGAPAMAIKELAGHSDLATTMRYMHLSPAAKESAIRLLEPATPPKTQEQR